MNWAVFGLTALAAAAAYAMSCWLWPFARCLKCDGKGKFQRADGRVWRTCRRCKGGGARLRVGRKVWNYLHHQRKAAK
jgi:hypothetical protein